MDIEKLIEQLNNLEYVAYGYNINGEVLGMECTEFECLMVDAATALSTLQAENEKLRKELEWKDMVIELAQRKQQEAEAALRREQKEAET